MVVVCESCSTRFRIDDARIPAKGRLVRCSQCKATFIATPASASFDEVVDEVVAEVTGAGGAPLPEAAADLFEAGGGDLDDPTTRPEPAFDEEGWEFDDGPRAPALQSEHEEPFERRDSSAPEPPALEEVGDPAEWDLLREAVEPASEARFVEPDAPRPVPLTDTAAEPFLDPIGAQPESPRPAQRSGTGSLLEVARAAVSAAAWLVLLGTAVVSIAPLLASDAGLRSPASTPRTYSLADGEARAVRAGFVENAFGRSLFVVQGELARPSADARLGLRAHLLDAAGARIGMSSWAGVGRPARELRELAPEALRIEIDASAGRAALGGPFVAFFEELPPDAAQFELALEPLPEPAASSASGPEPAAPAAVPAPAEPAAPAAAPAPAEPTAPSARPSSG